MKIKTKYIIILSICVLGNYNTASSMSTVKLLASEKTQSVMAQNPLNIRSSIASVKRGGAGFIIIQGRPNTRYSIRTSYKIGDKSVPILQIRTTDNTGEATFNWVVSKDTVPGTYNASIFGAGNTLNINHIVLK